MKTSYQLSVISYLRTLRIQRQYSQSKVACYLGISTGQMSNIETFKAPHKYTLAQIYLLCQEFQISITEVFLTQDEQRLPESDKINALIQNIIQYEQ